MRSKTGSREEELGKYDSKECGGFGLCKGRRGKASPSRTVAEPERI
jgi:hypothetical protein